MTPILLVHLISYTYIAYLFLLAASNYTSARFVLALAPFFGRAPFARAGPSKSHENSCESCPQLRLKPPSFMVRHTRGQKRQRTRKKNRPLANSDEAPEEGELHVFSGSFTSVLPDAMG